MTANEAMPRSAWAFPLLAALFFATATVSGVGFTRTPAGLVFAILLLVILFGTVFAAVHHAEIIAHRIGEPFGTLLLTLSVTIIEVAMIETLLLSGKANPALARDTVFAVVMIVCNGLVGVCILTGGLRFREQEFQVPGANLYLSVLVVLATITLVLPNYTVATPGPIYSEGQLAFVSVMTIFLYAVFLYIQTVRHRDYFIRGVESDDHGAPVSGRVLALSAVLLLLSLVSVVLLAKKFSDVVDAGAAAIGAPPAFAGVVVALLILMPEGVAAIGAAGRNDLQKSLNLALGSSLATIGLTVPAVAAVNIWLAKPLLLGLEGRDSVLLVTTIILSMLTFGTGRTNILFGFVHVLVFAMFVFLALAP